MLLPAAVQKPSVSPAIQLRLHRDCFSVIKSVLSVAQEAFLTQKWCWRCGNRRPDQGAVLAGHQSSRQGRASLLTCALPCTARVS